MAEMRKTVPARDAQVQEREVEGYLHKCIKAYGLAAVKFIPDYERGFPDRLILLPEGRVVWVELKRPVGGRLSAAQRVAHERLRRMGQRVELVNSKAQVDALIADLGLK